MCPVATSSTRPSGNFRPSLMMVFKSEPSGFADSTRPPLRSRKKSLPDVGAFFVSASIGVEAIALMERTSSITCLSGLDNAPSRALAPTEARRQSGIDSPDGQSIRPSSSIQSNADWRACSAPNNLSTARMKADSSFSARMRKPLVSWLQRSVSASVDISRVSSMTTFEPAHAGQLAFFAASSSSACPNSVRYRPKFNSKSLRIP